MLLVFDHSAEVISEPAADRENGEHLDEVRERRRVLERMRRVGVGITAAVGAEHFDRDLRRHRSLHDVLLGDGLFFHHRLVIRAFDRLALVVLLFDLDFHRLHQLGLGVTVEILNHALRDQKHREDKADRAAAGNRSTRTRSTQKLPMRLRRMPRDRRAQTRRRWRCRWRRKRNCGRPARPSARNTTWWIPRRSSASWCWW